MTWTVISTGTTSVTGGALGAWDTGGMGDGLYTLRLVVTDTIGHASAYSVTVTVDNTAPWPPFAPLRIEPDIWVPTNAFTVSWGSNPSDVSGIAGAYYKVGTAPTSTTDGVYRVGANITSISGITVTADGEYRVYVWLRDNAGNADHHRRQISENTIRYDATPPNVTLVSPTGGQWRGGDVITIAWTATDAISGLQPTPITLSYSTDGGGSWTTILVTNNTGSYNWVTPMVDSDQCQVRVEAVDQAGNVGQATSANFTIDSTAPGQPANLVAAPPGWNRFNSFTVSWDNPADLTGIAGAYHKVGDPPASATDGAYQAGGLTFRT